MSRHAHLPVQVTYNQHGEPTAIVSERWHPRTLPVLSRVHHWREWIGVLEGEPERDVWLVETPGGVCELHCLRHHPTGDEGEGGGGEWLLARWED